MVLLSLVGELGQGKTLGLAYMVWNNYYYKKRKIYANFMIYGIPFTPVKSTDDLREMIPPTSTREEILNPVEKFFAGDEMWRWVDSRTVGKGSKERNKIVNDILASSRKSFTTIAYSTQSVHQVDRRIRDITDIVVYPQISADGSYCKMLTFRGPKVSPHSISAPIYFYCEPIFAIYNTYEKVQELADSLPKREILVSIEKNPAWIKYLRDGGLTDEQCEDYCKKVQDSIRLKSAQ